MNTLSKVLAVFCVLLSAVVFARWEAVDAYRHPATFPGDTSSLATSADGKIVYFCKDHILFKSTDGGETWTVLK
jgi:photosystem II stability/assembly factor-like uncharacterized protein